MPVHFKENAKYLLGVSLLLSVLTLITFNIQNIALNKKVLGAETTRSRENETKKIVWLEFLKDHPTYLEGWIELAILEYENGDLEKADEYYLKAKEVDPNSEKLPW